MGMTGQRYFAQGNKLARQGKIEEAMIAFGHVIKENPGDAKAYNNLGMLFRKRHSLAEAEALLQRAIALDPNDAVFYYNLGMIYLDLCNLDQSEVCLKQALALKPQCAQFYNGLGLIYEEKNDLVNAEKAFRTAIQWQIGYSDGLLNLGIFLKSIFRFDEAEYYLQQAGCCQGSQGQAKLALATLYLLQGKYQIGWDLYEDFRLRQVRSDLRYVSLWNGEELNNSKVLLFFEQGFGDTIQFVRYAAKVKELAAEVVVWVQPSLKSLLSFSYPQLTIYDKADLPDVFSYDFIASLISLPKAFKTEATSIPSDVSYLRISNELALKWKCKLSATTRDEMKIGIVWSGNPNHANDRKRSIPFTVFRRLLRLPGIAWVSLQKGKRSSDARTVEKITDYSSELSDFSETAGLIVNLDLVITVDTAIAHLAGALGKPTWNLIPYFPDWRWQLQREDSPWYPTMRLFRQQRRGDWEGVVEQVTKALENYLTILRYRYRTLTE